MYLLADIKLSEKICIRVSLSYTDKISIFVLLFRDRYSYKIKIIPLCCSHICSNKKYYYTMMQSGVTFTDVTQILNQTNAHKLSNHCTLTFCKKKIRVIINCIYQLLMIQKPFRLHSWTRIVHFLIDSTCDDKILNNIQYVQHLVLSVLPMTKGIKSKIEAICTSPFLNIQCMSSTPSSV